MNMPKAPTPPNYNEIIEEELAKIHDDSFAKKIRKLLVNNRKEIYYINSAYNDARVESFVASTIARMDAEYSIYCMNLDKYKFDLEKYNSKIEKQITEYENQRTLVEKDFDTAKEFYDRFQNLVSRKVTFLNKLLNKILNVDGESKNKKENNTEKIGEE